jgi:hypothetical protein
MIRTLFIFLLLVVGMVSVAQPPVNRGSGSITVVDSRIRAALNFGIPIYADTTAANLSVGLDSLGTQIYSRGDNSFYGRKVNGSGTKYWASLGGGSTLVEDIGIVISGSDIRTNTPAFRTVAAMRSVAESRLDTGTIYWRNTGTVLIPYKWNDTATTTDDSVTFIQRTGTPTGRFQLYFESYIYADWFGAVAGDGIDDSYYVQKAINFALNSSRNPEVIFSGGSYIVNNVVIGKKSADEFAFATITLKGNSNFVSQTTQFTCNNGDAFCLAVQKGRSVTIEGIKFVGSSSSITGLRNMVEASTATYTSGVRNNQYSPHSAIVIDPFSVNVISADQYPSMSSWYTNTSLGGTSMVSIINCSFLTFVNGIMAGPSGSIQNGDNVTVSYCYFEANKNCFSSGQTQSRANKLQNCYMLFNQSIVNGVDYGDQQGTVADIINCNMAGGTKYIYQTNGGFSGVNVIGSYSESLYSIGLSGDMPVSIVNTQLTMSRYDVDEMYITPVLAEGSQLSFVGSSIEYFDNINATLLVFNISGELSFIGSKIRAGVPINSYYKTGSVVFRSVDYANSETTSKLDESYQIPSEDISTLIGKHITPGMGYKLRQGFTTNVLNDKIETTFLETATIQLEAATHTAYFLSSEPGRYRVDDALGEIGSAVSNPDTVDNYSGTQGALGVVIEISGDTIRFGYVPYGIDDNTSHDVYLVRIPLFLPRILADATNGSDTLRNVQTYGGALVVGQRVRGTGIADGSYITYIGAGKLTISIPATATNTNIEVYDAQVQFSSRNSTASFPLASNPIMFTGDYIDATYSNTGAASDSVSRWVVTTAGVVGGSPAPVFDAVGFGQDYINGLYKNNRVVQIGDVIPASVNGQLLETRYLNLNNFSFVFDGTNGGDVQVPKLIVGPIGGYDASLTFSVEKVGGNTVVGARNNDNNTNYVEYDLRKLKAGSFSGDDGNWLARFNFNTIGRFGAKFNNTTWAAGAVRGFDYVWEGPNASGTEAERMRLTGAGSLVIGTTSITNSELLRVNGGVKFDLGSDATGDVFYRASNGALTRLPIGTDGQFLSISSGLPSWNDGGGTAYFRNGRTDYDTLFAEIGIDSFVIKSPNLSATTSSIITRTITDTTVAYAFQLAAETFTATLTNGSNVASSTVRSGRYQRVGDVVTGSLQVTIETTGAGATELDFSIPVTSAFSDRYDLTGNANNPALGGSVYANSTNDRATLSFSASGAGTTTFTITFQYTVFAP